MTEDEAHLKQCCGPEGCGRFNDDPFPARWCVGSACMAWRFDGEELKRTRVHTNAVEQWARTGWTVVDGIADQSGYVLIAPPADQVRYGYCGLAGAPQ